MSLDQYNQLLEHSVVNINGKIIPSDKAKISVFDRGFLYGDSIYEVTYSEDYTLLFFEDHLDRLEKSASIINMNLFLTRDEIKEQALKTLQASKIKNAYIRIIITRGETHITLDPDASFKNNFVIIVKKKPEYPQDFYSKGLKLAIVSILRNDKQATDPNAKSGNYLNNVLAIQEAKKLGAQDALMVNKEGYVTEGSTFNVWMIKDNYIITPPSNSGLLEGITRQKLISICKQKGLPLKIENFTAEDILNAQEVFITSSTRGLMPVSQINDIIYTQNTVEFKMYQKLSKIYKQVVSEHKECKDFYYK